MGTPALTRPQKVGNVTTYVAEVNYLAPADAPILAPEVDADLDTLYNAWNNPASAFPPTGAAGGDLLGSSYPAPVIAPGVVTTGKLNDGAVTDAKIAGVAYAKVTGAPTSLPPSGAVPAGDLQGSYPSPTIKPSALLWTPSGVTLTPADATKTLSVPAAVATAKNALVWGPTVARGRLVSSQGSGGGINVTANMALNDAGSAWAQDDTAQPGWGMSLQNSDKFLVFRTAPNNGATTIPLSVDSLGQLSTGPMIVSQAYGTTPIVRGQNAQGTPAAPTPVAQFGQLLRLEGQGCYQAGAFSVGAQLQLYAAETWTATARGTSAVLYLTPAGTTNSTATSFSYGNDGSLVLSGSYAQKATGTTWANPSDNRLKQDVAPYAAGLAELLQLHPVRFTYNGKAGTTAGLEALGFIADDVRPIMPEMVTTYRAKLNAEDATDSELLRLDTTALPLALLNAVQELATRVAALEARPA